MQYPVPSGQTPQRRDSAVALLAQLENLEPRLCAGAPDRLAIAYASRSISREQWLAGCHLRRLFQHAQGATHGGSRCLQADATRELSRLHQSMQHDDWTICTLFCVENLPIPAALALLNRQCAAGAALERAGDALDELVYYGRSSIGQCTAALPGQ